MTGRRTRVASFLHQLVWLGTALLGVPLGSLAQVQGGLGGGTGLPAVREQGAVATLNGPDSEPPSDCITQVQRAFVQERIAEYERRSGPFPRLSEQGEPKRYPFYPQGGNLWQDLAVINYVDLDATSGIRDWDCSDYTYDGHHGHDTDLRSFGEQAIGVAIFAALDGVVVDAHDGELDMNTSWQGQPANYVVLDHGGGHYTYYWHMKKGSVSVGPGETVPAGAQLGLTGSSGNSTGPHLHFESHYNGTWYEPSAGPCRPGKSYWVAQTPIRRDMYLRDLNVTAVNIADYPGLPFDMPRTGTFVAGTGRVSFWINLINMPASSTWRVRFVRPNSTVAWDSGTVAFNNPFYRWSWWWWYYRGDLSALGTWHILLDMNGQTQAQAPFEVVSTQSQVTNRPPYAVNTALDPPAPTGVDVIFCRVATSLISDDPDYDIVRYRYQWSVGDTTIRDVTHAGQADAIPRASVHAGETIVCALTPCDGLACGASTTVSAVVAAVPSATETPSPSPTTTLPTPGSPTPTPSLTRTATSTAVPTVTATQTGPSTPTATATASQTPTSTSTRTLTPKPTATETPTVTLTARPTQTRTPTLTPTQTPTLPTSTPTVTHTATATASATITLTPTATPSPTATTTPTPINCLGNCNDDGSVTVDELLTMVNIALGHADVSACLTGGANSDGQITIDEILSAVNNALNGCGPALPPLSYSFAPCAAGGDSLTVTEVDGTSSTLIDGARYRVCGSYTLNSRSSARVFSAAGYRIRDPVEQYVTSGTGSYCAGFTEVGSPTGITARAISIGLYPTDGPDPFLGSGDFGCDFIWLH